MDVGVHTGSPTTSNAHLLIIDNPPPSTLFWRIGVISNKSLGTQIRGYSCHDNEIKNLPSSHGTSLILTDLHSYLKLAPQLRSQPYLIDPKFQHHGVVSNNHQRE
jgi:hypothetical protein